MALIALRQLLDHAADNGYGVPAFNVNNLEQIQSIMQAADACDAPVIWLARFRAVSATRARRASLSGRDAASKRAASNSAILPPSETALSGVPTAFSSLCRKVARVDRSPWAASAPRRSDNSTGSTWRCTPTILTPCPLCPTDLAAVMTSRRP